MKRKPARSRAAASFPVKAAAAFREHAAAMRKLGVDSVSVKWRGYEMTAGWATPPERSQAVGFGVALQESE